MQARGDLLDNRAKNGETALHKAARYGYEQVCLLLLSAGASAGVRNEMFMTAIDVAGALDHFMEWQSAAASTAKPKIKVEPNVKARRKVRRAIMSACAWSRVLVVSHQECMLHATKLGHQEELGDPPTTQHHSLMPPGDGGWPGEHIRAVSGPYPSISRISPVCEDQVPTLLPQPK